MIATVVGWWVNSCADKYIVTFILGISANGLLSVSYKIPQIINTIQGIFTQAWQISAIKEYGSSDTADFYGKTFIVINLMMCIVCSFLIFMTRPLAYILLAGFDGYDVNIKSNYATNSLELSNVRDNPMELNEEIHSMLEDYKATRNSHTKIQFITPSRFSEIFDEGIQ